MNAPLTQKQVRDILDKTPAWASRHEYEIYCQHYQKMVNDGMGEKALALWHENYWRKDSTLRKILCHLDEFFDDETEEFRRTIPHPSPFGVDATDADISLAAPIADYLDALDTVRSSQMESDRLMREEQEKAAARSRRRYLSETGAIRYYGEDTHRGAKIAGVLIIMAGVSAFWWFAGKLLYEEFSRH